MFGSVGMHRGGVHPPLNTSKSHAASGLASMTDAAADGRGRRRRFDLLRIGGSRSGQDP